VLPFLIAGLTLIHLALLHKIGSNSPIGSDTGIDDISFYVRERKSVLCFNLVIRFGTTKFIVYEFIYLLGYRIIYLLHLCKSKTLHENEIFETNRYEPQSHR